MKVILETDISGLGEEGSVVDVSSGYARNHLLPAKKAMYYNAQNISVLKSKMASIEKRRAERRAANQSLKERLEKESLSIMMKASDAGHLYGAVTAHIIADELEKKGISIAKSNIVLPDGHTIKSIGIYNVIAKLYHSVQARFTVAVADQNGNTAVAAPTIKGAKFPAQEAPAEAVADATEAAHETAQEAPQAEAAELSSGAVAEAAETTAAAEPHAGTEEVSS